MLCNPTVKQAYGVEASAAGRRPPYNIVEANITHLSDGLILKDRSRSQGRRTKRMVAVLDTKSRVLAPASQRRSKMLLRSGKAAVFRRYPFTIILKREVKDPLLPSMRVKIDPGRRGREDF
jgi:hypothetical protein